MEHPRHWVIDMFLNPCKDLGTEACEGSLSVACTSQCEMAPVAMGLFGLMILIWLGGIIWTVVRKLGGYG